MIVNAPNLLDIARRAGVGKSTAARALSGQGAVSAVARRKVLTAASALKYRANSAARALRRGENRLLGIVVPNSASLGILSSAVAAPKLEGIARAAKSLGYDLQIFIEDLRDGEALRRLAVEKDVRAFFFLGGVKPPTLELLDRYGIPWVGVNWRHPERSGDHHAWTDFRHAGQTLAGHLVQAGCRRLLAFDWLSENYGPFGAGVREAWAAAGRHSSHLWLCAGDHYTGGAPVALELARALDRKDHPDGLLMGHRDGLLLAYRALKERGLAPGRDVAVVTFDDLDAPLFLDPPCTAYAQPFIRMGEAAVEMLDRRLAGEAPQPECAVPGELRVRASTMLFRASP